MNQLQFIDQQRVYYPVRLLCHVLRGVPSRYHAWCRRAVPKAEPARETVTVGVFDAHQRRHGTRRRQVELRELGHRVGRQALRTALRRHGRKAPHHRSDPRHAMRPQPAARPAEARPGQPGVGR